MATVIFPNDNKISYPEPSYYERNRNGFTDMYKSQNKVTGAGEGWIAQIPNTCIIDVRKHWEIEIKPFNAENAISYLLEHKDEAAKSPSSMRSLKRMLSTWSIRNRRFK